MDAHFFRALAQELEINLNGRRVEKIFSPADGVWTFSLQSTGGKEFLLFRPAKSVGLFFLSRVKPLNPANPPANVMWLRKRLSGRRIFEAHHDWVNLRVAFTISPGREPGRYKFLLFDLKKGVSLIHELPEDFGAPVLWPSYAEIKDTPEIWKEFPQISPPLRKAMDRLSPPEAQTLLNNLESGTFNSFYISTDIKDEFAPPRVWPLKGSAQQKIGSAIEASSLYGEKVLFPTMEKLENSEDKSALKSGKKKFKRVMNRIEQEEDRLRDLLKRKIDAEALQAEMYRIKPLRALEKITVNHPEQGEIVVALDPLLTPMENMTRIFKFAAKASRGLKHMERRRKEVEDEQDVFLNQNLLPPSSKDKQKKNIAIPTKYKNIAVALFVSSDGFLIIRGKNSKANHDILGKVSSVFDYWFHVEGGPGSHVILKRDHPGQEVPEKTFEEAATLAALKSYKCNDSKAEVMCALVKDVRKIKGGAPGQVLVDNVSKTLHVEIDPSLEESLAKK
ncbi:NFACT RNA binding domain-containing protein [Maridesulfovibrio frigidus]|uniref:NFACT RNA binding domain-containing protein n=1 Tax=Maridesulfovibrio frigidus TaxID=340956 RepID=UPI0004E1B8D0|nr:NFACT RNA binding domain-containing protein [Maridesulfovibrio frigidus]